MKITDQKMDRQELYEFLVKTDQLFPTPISQKTDLCAYAEKLHERADIVSCIDNDRLCGVAAGYITNSVSDMAYISMVAVLPGLQGRGIGAEMVRAFISRAEKAGKKGVHLYAVYSNMPAMRMYRKIGFEEYVIENEPLPDNAHLVYWMR